MTISLVPHDSRQRRFQMTGGETVLPVTFPFFAAADLLLLRHRGGSTATLLLGADYTVTGAGNPAGGAATLTAPAQAGDLVVLLSAQPDARATGWADGQALTAAALNAEFARKWIGMQQMRRDLDRSVRLPAIDPPGGLELPAAASRANRFLGFDGSGNALAMGAPDAPLGAVARTGDTMTGDLTISKSNAIMGLSSPTPSVRAVRWRTNGVERWGLTAYPTAETGGNVGSELHLERYNDHGVFLGSIFQVNRADGRLTFLENALPRLPGIDPTDPNDVTRRAYVDAQRDTRIARTGDVMTGNLVLPAGGPVGSTDAAHRAYVDAIPAGKTSVHRNTWNGIFDLLPGTPTTFFDILLPANTAHVIGSGFVRMTHTGGTDVVGIFSVNLLNEALTQVTQHNFAILASTSLTGIYVQTGGHVGFNNIPVNNNGWRLRFTGHKDNSSGPFNVNDYQASILCVQR